MQDRKYKSEDIILIILAWLMALSLAYLVWVKFKMTY
jgi:hypothetical protein